MASSYFGWESRSISVSLRSGPGDCEWPFSYICRNPQFVAEFPERFSAANGENCEMQLKDHGQGAGISATFGQNGQMQLKNEAESAGGFSYIYAKSPFVAETMPSSHPHFSYKWPKRRNAAEIFEDFSAANAGNRQM